MRQESRNQFSLVELIVAITVVLVLVALLAIPLARARRKSHEAVCASQLGQIGIAMIHYADEWGSYPWLDPLQDNFNTPKINCPANKLTDFDPYSVGYYGGHPRTSAPNDFLVVCGCHDRGPLALYGDFHVANAAGKDNEPIMMSVAGQAVTPGYVFTNSGNLDLLAPNGQTAQITGVQDAQLISAYYDPMSWNGSGEFVVLMAARVPDDNHPSTTVDHFRVKGNSYVAFTMRLEYAIVSLRKEPNQNTQVMWKAKGGSDVNDVAVHKSFDHWLKHRYNATAIDNVGSSRFQYDTSPWGITPR